MSLGQRLINEHYAVQSTDLIYAALVQDFLASIYKTTGTYLCLNNDLRKLPCEQRSIMLLSAADNVACMTGVFAMQHCHLYGLDTFLTAMETKYGQRTIDIHRWATKFIDPDIILVKLAISLFALCENTCVYSPNISKDLTNPIDILEIQNRYAEVTWKYLVYRYGDYEAVKRFLNLALWLRAISVLTFHARTLAVHVNDINSLVEQTELELLLDDFDQIVERNE